MTRAIQTSVASRLSLSFWFALILSAHVFLGAFYAFIIPMGEAYDEAGHYIYIRYLVEERQIPQVTLVESLRTPGMEDLQFSQPPLYYLLAALATFWIPAPQGFPLEINPHVFVDGLNLFVHPPQETTLYRQEFLALLGGRFVSILLSTIVVAATYFLTRILFPERKDIILGATGLTAFNPMFVFMGSVVNNDVAVTAFSSLFILSAVWAVLRPALRHWLGMGLFLDLAILSKYNALALFPIAALVLVAGIFRLGLSERKLVLQGSLLTLGILIFAIVWWFIPGTPLSGGPLRRFPGLLEQPAADVGDPFSLVAGFLHYFLSPRLEGTFYSFWGVFGVGNILMDGWVYRLLALAVLLAVFGWWRSARSLSGEQKWVGMLCVATVATVLFVGIYRELNSTIPVVGRYLFPVLSPLSVLLAGGLAFFLPRLRLHLILGGGLFLLALFVPFLYIRPAYALPPLYSSEENLQIQTPLRVRFGEEIEALGYTLDTSRAFPGGEVQVTLYLKALRPISQNYTLALHLLDPAYEAAVKHNFYPGRGNWATSLWRPGEIIEDAYSIRIPEQYPAPTQAWLKVAFFLHPQGAHLEVRDDQGHSLGEQVLVAFAIRSLAPPSLEPQNLLEATVGDLAGLRGYTVSLETNPPRWEVLLWWEALRNGDGNYTVFVHLLDEEGRLMAQHDSPPRGGAYPTVFWQAGEQMIDEHVLSIPSTLPAGRYRLMAGMYNSESLVRLPAFDPRGERYLHDLIPLGEIVWPGP